MAQMAENGGPQSKPYIVVAAVDFSSASDAAITEAVRIAREHSPAQAHFVHVVSEREGAARHAWRLERDEALLASAPHALRAHVATRLSMRDRLTGRMRVGYHVRLGSPSQAILQLAADLAADMIVVGAREAHGARRLFVGSVAGQLIRDARCPVLVARPKAYEGVEISEQPEPVCDLCARARGESQGARWWCEVHTRDRPPTHVHSTTEVVSWATHDSDFAGPTGVKMIF